jgi:hypothetical protein
VSHGLRQTSLRARSPIRFQIGDAQGLAVLGVDQLLAEGGQVVLRVGGLNVRDQLGALVDQKHPPPQEIAGRAQALGIDVSLGQVAAAQEIGDLRSVDLVVLGLAAVNGLHVQGVAEHEDHLLAGTEVGEPVPGEHALGGDDQSGAEGRQRFEQSGGFAGDFLVEHLLAGVVEDAQVQGSGMQIDAAVELVRLIVETHHGSPWAWVRELEPASWLEGTHLPEDPTLGRRFGVNPLYPWDRLPAHPNGGHEEYPADDVDRAGIAASRVTTSLQPARQLNLIVQIWGCDGEPGHETSVRGC